MRVRLLGLAALLLARPAAADRSIPEGAVTWSSSCKPHLEKARAALAAIDPALGRATIELRDGLLGMLATDGAGRLLRAQIGETHRDRGERNNWNPPPDEWTLLPIIDKAYSLTKLRLFRFGARLEALIEASGDEREPRAPPIPPRLAKPVAILKRALEACLRWDG
jgi:hypothetical protein